MAARSETSNMEALLVLTLGFDPVTLARLQTLRDRYVQPERNVVPAHLSLLHQLPGREAPAVRTALAALARSTRPLPLTFLAPRKLGSGVALPVACPALLTLFDRLKDAFAPWIAPQDRQPFQPHVTLQIKATPAEIDRALAELMADFPLGHAGWAGTGTALLLWRYRGGPWEEDGTYPLGVG